MTALAGPRPTTDYGKLPLTFEANAGQADGRVKYLSRGAGYTLFLTSGNEAVVSLARTTAGGERLTTAVRMTMPGSKDAEAIRALEPQSNVSNYIYGNDPKRWLTGVKHYGRVSYESVYPGIDVVYYGNQRQLEYDFVVAPGADPGAIRLKFDAERVSTENGDLLLHKTHGPLRQLKPVVYQEIDGKRRYIASNYVVRNKEVRFALGKYDRSKTLVIDPILVYSTYLGGSGVENGFAVTVDSTQAAYVVGSTASTDFPLITGTSGQTTFKGGATDAFVVKYSPSGSGIAFSTYIGGSGADSATGVGVDANGNILIGGSTDSTNFPLRNPMQPTIGGKTDAFLVKLAPSGALVFSTFIGGFEDDQTLSLVVDGGNNAVLGGVTRSTNFWASGGLRPAFQGGATDGWVFKMNSDGVRLWSTYMGGVGNDSVNGVAVDTQNNVYLTGGTTSLNFPVSSGVVRTTLVRTGYMDAFVTKLDPNGALSYSTYLGGREYDEGIEIAVDLAGQAYVAGDTDSILDFPTRNTLQGPPGNRDLFVTKLNATATDYVFSTYLGGSGVDNAADITVDAAGDAYVIGTTTSSNFPVGSPLQATLRGPSDVFITKINAAGTARVWSSYLGGLSDDVASSIAIDNQSNLYLAGSTISIDFPHIGAQQPAMGGAQDAFVAKIAGCDIVLAPTAATFAFNAASGSFSVNATNCPWNATASDSSWITITSPASGSGTANITYTIAANTGFARTGYISVSGVQYAISQAGLSTAAPSVVSLSPNAGGGTAQTFTAIYATANPGGAPIDRVYFLMNTVVNGTGGCLVEYSPATNSFRLINNDGISWSGSATAGTAVTLSNSQCSLNVATSSGSTATGTGSMNTTVNYALTFGTGFSGLKNVYLIASSESAGLTSGWVQAGTWTVNGSGGGGTPGVLSLVPTTGTGYIGSFTGNFTHTGGATQHYLGYMLFLPTPNVVNYTATGSCLVEYNRISNGMRLIDNAGTGWLGGESGIPLGTPGAVLTNNQCTVNVQNATAFVAGNMMSVNVPVTFQATLGPVLGTFLQALDVNGVWTGMTQFGNWVLPGAPQTRLGPAISGITPTNTAGSSVTYTITATHPNGAGALSQVHLMISDRIVGGSPCQIVYFPGNNTLNLINDTGSALVSPTGVTPGTPGSLGNSRCALNTTGAAVSAAGANLSVVLPLTFNVGTFAGGKNVYGIAFDNLGVTSHWVQGATLNVQ
jgi:hypothetical protein